MRRAFVLLAGMFCTAAHAATNIDVSTRVIVPAVKRFGINLGWMNYYDSGQIMKNLIFRNPGFEGQIYHSIVRVSTTAGAPAPTATSFVDENNTTHWPTGFWNGASYEVIVGTAKGRSGTISTSTVPADTTSNGTGIGTRYQLADSGTPPAPGDYIILRKSESGGAAAGWLTSTSGAGTITTELADLALDTLGHQAVRLTAPGTSDSARVGENFDTSPAGPFVQLNGHFRLSFKAKNVGGGNVSVFLGRGAPANLTYINQTQALTNVWTTYNLDFTASESGTSMGTVQLSFTTVNQPATILLDDVSLLQTDGDPTNTTVFRDPVVNALKSFNPGILRYWVEDLGDSLDNEIAAPFARLRAGYSSQATQRDDLLYGLHEFLELCDLLHTEPWFIVPTTFRTQEMSDLIEYLSGPSGSTYGSKRAARGRAAPWTDAFTTIHLEFGNEAWNNFNYYGGTISDPNSYGMRGSEMFGVARASAYYSPSKYDLVLGGHGAEPNRNLAIHNASSNHDSLAVAPYFGGHIDSYSTNEQLFGPLFAEPEMLEQTGYMRQNYNNLRMSSRPVPLCVYEVNLHTTDGSIPQSNLDSFTPSVGAGVAVADHMLQMLRDLNIRNQVLYSLTQYANGRSVGPATYVLLWGTVRDMGVSDRKRPQFLAVKLANEALSGDAVRTTQSGDNPTWSVDPAVNQILYDNAHIIQSFAFVNGNFEGVIVFNLDRVSSQQVTFTGPNAPSGAVVMRRLVASSITDTNESAENVVIQTTNLSSFDPSVGLTLPPFSMTVLSNGATPPPLPTGVQATAQSTSQVTVNWQTSGNSQYAIYRMFNAGAWQMLATVSAPPYSDSGLAASTAYLYRIRAVAAGGTSPVSAPDVATTIMFSDDPLVPGQTVVRGDHVSQLRDAANAVRVTAGLTPQSWTDPTIVAGSTLIQAAHILELRNSITNSFGLLGLTIPPFTNAIFAGAVVHAADIQELRNAVH